MKLFLIIYLFLIYFFSSFLWGKTFEEGMKFYDKGEYSKALDIWKPLANSGEAESQYMFGLMHAEGKGVPQNFKIAVYWYKFSSEQGYSEAQNNLGLMYTLGQGTEKNLVLAYMWFSLVDNYNLDVAKIAKKNLNFITNIMSADQIKKAMIYIELCKKINLKDCEKIEN